MLQTFNIRYSTAYYCPQRLSCMKMLFAILWIIIELFVIQTFQLREVMKCLCETSIFGVIIVPLITLIVFCYRFLLIRCWIIRSWKAEVYFRLRASLSITSFLCYTVIDIRSTTHRSIENKLSITNSRVALLVSYGCMKFVQIMHILQ